MTLNSLRDLFVLLHKCLRVPLLHLLVLLLQLVFADLHVLEILLLGLDLLGKTVDSLP